MRLWVWGMAALSGALSAARAGDMAARLAEDAAFVETQIAGRLRMFGLAREALAVLKRRHPEPEGAGRIAVAEARLLGMEAAQEADPARRRSLQEEARRRLSGAIDAEALAADAFSVRAVAAAESALALARLEADIAEASGAAEAFPEVARRFEDLMRALDRLVEKAREAARAGALPEEAFRAADQRLYEMQAETRYEWAKAHLAWGQAPGVAEERRGEILARAAEEFDNAALLTEDERRPDLVFYPAPYLGKAAAERAMGDRAAARRTLEGLLARKIRHADATAVRTAAMRELVDLALADKDWKAARAAAAALEAEGAAAAAALARARVDAEEALAARQTDDQDWRRRFDAGLERLADIAARGGGFAAEAASWRERYAALAGGGLAPGAGEVLARADDRQRQGDYSGALALYGAALAALDPPCGTAQAPRIWDRIAFCLYKVDRFADAAAAWAQAAGHAEADAALAVGAAERAHGALAKWLTAFAPPLAPRDRLQALHAAATRSLKEDMVARFPRHPGVNGYRLDLAAAARAAGDLEGALALYAGVTVDDPDRYLAALTQTVACRRLLLVETLKAAGGRLPRPEEVEPLAAACEALLEWLAGPAARGLDAAVARSAAAEAITDAGYHMALAFPERVLAALDAFGRRHPGGETPLAWTLYRAIAEARRGRIDAARAAWDAARARVGASEPPPAMRVAAHVLGRAATQAAQAARNRGDDAAARAAAVWVTDLLTFTLGVKENPTAEEIAALVSRFEWQVQKTPEPLAAIGIGEFILDRAAAWRLSEDVRLRVLTGLSDAYAAVEEWEPALRVSREVDEIHARRGRLARWARERAAQAARRLGEAAVEPAARRAHLEAWYETCRSLREVTPPDDDAWWDYTFQMGLSLLLQEEHGVLRDFLGALFAQAPDLGGARWRGRFMALAEAVWRRGDDKVKPFAEALLSDMWARRAAAIDPLAARLAR